MPTPRLLTRSLVAVVLLSCGGHPHTASRPAVTEQRVARAAVDRCPDEPEDLDGFEDADGCPDPDNDHDGIPDVADRCPNEPETYNGYEDSDGCPDRGCVIVRAPGDCLLATVFFRAGKVTLVPVISDGILDDVVATIQGSSNIERLAIRGHRATGEPATTSAKRAAVVRDALVKRGVTATRLELVDVGTAESAARSAEASRRVDFAITKQAVANEDADDVACSSVGPINIHYTEAEKQARCVH